MKVRKLKPTTGQMEMIEEANGLTSTLLFESDTASAGLATGGIRFNNATYANVTEIYIDYEDIEVLNIQSFTEAIATDDNLLIKGREDPLQSVVFTVLSLPVDSTGFYTISVAHNQSGTGGVINAETLVGFAVIKASTNPWKSVTFDYTDFQTAATTNTITVYTLVDGEEFEAAIEDPTADEFDGTGITAVTMSLGLTAEPEKYTPDFDIKQEVDYSYESNFSNEMFSTSTAIIATIKSTGANLDQLTDGIITFKVKTFNTK